MNNKGMAISGILYSLLILFIILVLSILALMATSKHTLDKVKNDVLNDLNSPITAKITFTPNITTSTTDSVFVTAYYKPAVRKESDWIYEYSIDEGATWIEVEEDTYIHEFIYNGTIKARIRTEKSILVENVYKVTNIVEPILVAGNTGGTTVTSRYLTTDTNQTLLRQDIETVEIVNHKTIPAGAVGSYDVSEAKNGSVMLWYILGSSTGCGASSTSQCYKVYIGAKDIVFANENSSYLFGYLTKLNSISLTYLDTSKVTNMSVMFGVQSVNGTGYSGWGAEFYKINCANSNLVTTLDLNNFNTSKVTNMSYMFECLVNLTNLNIKSFDTSDVTDMSYMFTRIGNTSLDISSFDFSNTENMSYMFNTAENLTTITTLAGVNKINWDTSKAMRMTSIFANTKLSSLEFGNDFVTTNVTRLNNMFYGMQNLMAIITPAGTNKINWDTSQVTFFAGMFANTKLSSLEFGSNFVTNSATSMNSMFSDMDNLTSIITDGKENYINWNTSNVTTTEYMFYNTKLSSIEFESNFITANVTTMHRMFCDMTNLTSIITPAGTNKINWNTSKVTNMSSMFQKTQLPSIEFGSSFVTSNVTSMNSMFILMTQLNSTTGLDLRYFDFSKVTDYTDMIRNVPTTAKITVNQAGYDFLNPKFPRTYTVIP